LDSAGLGFGPIAGICRYDNITSVSAKGVKIPDHLADQVPQEEICFMNPRAAYCDQAFKKDMK
jgi:hypothetical protein